MYESDELLAQYLLLHYGEAKDVLPWEFGPAEALDYPVRCVNELMDAGRLPEEARALDIGCAVGRSSFELARWCGRVTGIDLSERFIATAQALADSGAMTFSCPVEGDIRQVLTFPVPPEIQRSRVRFETGDACHLRPALTGLDLVLAANLVDRLPEPGRFLDQMSERIVPGGQLLLASPFTWMDEFTPREHWLGGTAGHPTWETLCERLDPDFELKFDTDLPFLIREHARKYQWSVARAGRWIRRA